MLMAFHCFYKRGLQPTSSNVEEYLPQPTSSSVEDDLPQLSISGTKVFSLVTNWEDVFCPICLDYPHNCVLLQCSSLHKGCRAFVCDTNHLHSNCLERFKTAYGVPAESKSPLSSESDASEVHPASSENNGKPACPLCRGEVNGWLIMEKARDYLDQKKRCCEENKCSFSGTFKELQKHAQLEHPNSHPSKIDPMKKLDWENFQQSSEIIDVLSTIHSEVPRGVVLGDYVIEYGDDDAPDEFDEFPSSEGNWWTSCIFYQVFDNLRNSRHRRRSRARAARRGSHHSSYDTSNSDDGSVTSIEFPDYRVEDVDDEYVNGGSSSRTNAGDQSSRRRRSRFYDN